MIVVIAFFILLFIGVPIAFVLGITSLVYVFATSDYDIFSSLPLRMMNGLQNFGLIAIPMFVLLGEIMNRGGVTEKLISFSKTIFGHLVGGLAYVNIAANMFLASIIGSANAQTAIMGKVIVPAMEKEGYKKDFSAALTASSSILGPLIPPSMPFIIYGVTAGVSIGSLFLSGIIPGIMFALVFCLLIYIIAKKNSFPKSERSPLIKMVKEVLYVLPALCIPFLIVFGITSGIFTATESAAVSVLFAAIIGFFIYRKLKLKHLWNILLRTCVVSSIVTFLIATSSIFGYVIAYQRIPELIAEMFLKFAENPLVFLLLCNLLLLLVGMFIEGVAALVLLTPILLPVAINYGIDPIHFGVIMVTNLTLGLMTPPVGTVLFIASSVTNVKIERIVYSLIPFLIVSFIILLFITYIPWISLYIPGLLR